jgi:hypothetical protein
MTVARRGLTAGVLAIALVALASGTTWASSRPYTPLTVAVARADVIVAVRIVGLPLPGPGPGHVEALLVHTFKGAPAGPWLTIVLEPHELELLHRLSPGVEAVLFLAADRAPARYRIAEPTFLQYSESATRRLAGVIANMPTWSDASAGLSAIIVPDHDARVAEARDPVRFRAGEAIVLWAGYRNVSRQDAVLRYRDWPLEAHTDWELSVERVGAGRVAPLAHPHVDAAGIRDFFSRNTHRFEVTLKPGESFFLYLDRINSAEAGWGYKERIGFRYYPMTLPGEYTISAAGRYFHDGGPIATRTLRVWVE